MTAILAVARNTFREGIRSKILWSVVFFAVLGMILTIAMAELAVREHERLLRDLGLASLSMFGVIASIFMGVSMLYKELELRTVYVIIPKPIRRWHFVLGKFLGMAATLLVLVALLAVVFAGVLVQQGTRADGALVRAVVLVVLELLVLCAVGVLFSSWTTPYLSGLFTLGVFVLGRSAGEIDLLVDQSKSAAVRSALRGLQVALPDLALFYPSGAVVEGTRRTIHGAFVGWDYVGMAGAYGLAYIGVALTLSAILFSRRDFV